MMNLEGTKHEKAVLVVIAYIIGFTSSFIVFGVADELQKQAAYNDTDLYYGSQWQQVPAPTDLPTDFVPPSGQPPVDVSASYEEGKLYAQVGAERYLLSLHSEVMPIDNVEGFATQGIHEALPQYTVSPDGRFVHFCEQQATAAECTHFVFDIAANLIHPVEADDASVTTPNSDAMATTWQNGLLVIGSAQSVTADMPWVLAAQ